MTRTRSSDVLQPPSLALEGGSAIAAWSVRMRGVLCRGHQDECIHGRLGQAVSNFVRMCCFGVTVLKF